MFHTFLNKLLLLPLFAFLIYTGELCAQEEPAIDVSLEYIEGNNGNASIIGMLQNNEIRSSIILYEMTVARADDNGNIAKNKQSGSITLIGNEQIVLSAISLSVSEKNKIYIELLVYDFLSGSIIAKKVFGKKNNRIPNELKKPLKEKVENKKPIDQSTTNKTKTVDKKIFEKQEEKQPIDLKSKQNQQVKELVKKAPEKTKIAEVKKEIEATISKQMPLKDKQTIAEVNDNEISEKEGTQKVESVTSEEIVAVEKTVVVKTKNEFKETEIDGLIIDETRSKIARDFYYAFYTRWTAPDNATDFIITIKELPSRGGASARISVWLNNEEMFQRMVQNRGNYIESLAKQTVTFLQNKVAQSVSLQKQLEDEDQQGSGLF